MNQDQEIKLTAYALGELEAAQNQEVEMLLAQDPAAQEFLKETKQMAQTLNLEFKKEGTPMLTEKNLESLQSKLDNILPLASNQKNFRPWWQFASVAATVLIIAGLTFIYPPAPVEKNILLEPETPRNENTQIEKSENKAATKPNQMLAQEPAYLKKSKDDVLTESGLQNNLPADTGYYPLAKTDPSLAVDAENNFNTETYDNITDNTFQDVAQNPLSTFSIDVDTASYANIRRYLNQGTLPPKDAVRIEEMINYFTYQDVPPSNDKPFAVKTELAKSPWHQGYKVVRIGMKGKEIAKEQRGLSNLVFLIDVSGSMFSENKLPLLKRSFKLLVDQLGENDRVAIVTYAGSSGLVLPATPANEKEKILAAIDNLNAGGSTNGAQGINLAYDVATKAFIKDGSNRVILATDGDFNIGVTNQGDLTRLIQDKAQSGVFLSVLGFGMGNYKDSTMEKLADKGNGNYAYIDSDREAQKVLVQQASGTLMTIAKDVKVQVEFNPAKVSAYRLVGYENRMLRKEDFNNDKIDAGEIGAGHTVTALYEIVPTGQSLNLPGVDPLKYQKPIASVTTTTNSPELLTVKVRYKNPDGQQSQLLTFPLADSDQNLSAASSDLRFATAVAEFGMILRESPYKGNATYAQVLDLAQGALGEDTEGYRHEFIKLVEAAKGLAK